MGFARAKKSQKLIILLVLVALFLIPTYLIPDNPLFYSTLSDMTSNYGFFVILFVVLPLLVLNGLRLDKRIHEKNLGSKLVRYLGFKRSKRQAVIGLVLGSLAGLITWNIIPHGMGGHSITGVTVFSMLLLAPLAEEIIFRGFLINQLLSVGRSKKLKALAIIASVFIFAWGHAKSPELKVIGGSLYTLLYLWGWGRNLTAAISAHFGGNAVVLLSGFSKFGFQVALKVLTVVGLAFLTLMIMVWKAEDFARLTVKGLRKMK